MVDETFFGKNGRILGKFTKGAKFLLILTALFQHQPTYKNLEGTLKPFETRCINGEEVNTLFHT